ncbi:MULTISPECIES: molecular chaperone DnaK [Acidiplasma]|jgi:molecular chaperone DnaK|uniref:Chaperone protein DnaK n=2 Tax=Acidiplasma TaxID=507753 RepID=A0A0Q0RLJ2_9ARCH|nr:MULTISPECIES: molecular chaperone DnaK [Acidiplasma]KJE49369.1 molecular chaperone DnaK [Acidiplasma sp. MBA-1]KQB36453.1 molecular chaperone DnaK [Acidiplasma cupricumulans]WMT54689.1 MAG: molecular chaperone DnaK [Acidiplasma sp.]
MSKIIGIDLGTSNSAAAVVISGKPEVIPAAEGVSLGGKSFPSYVAFTKDGQLLVGEPARRQALLNPEGTVYAAKRKMGTDYKYKIFGKEYTPQQISAFILQKIKKDAETFLGEPVTDAVITVPAYFDDNQRQATKDAGAIAGLNVRRIINEPTAACMAYGIDKLNESLKILIYDFGGGTLDVTVMDFGQGVFQVLSTSGDTHLGGSDMDEAIVNFLADDFKQKEGIDLRKDKSAYIRLRDAAEKAKIELSTVLETDINLPYITATQEGPKHLEYKLTRAKLEELVAPIVEKSAESLNKAIEGAKLKKEDINKIILIGGPTRMPYVHSFIEKYFGKKPEGGVDPMQAVAIGAAIQGAVLTGDIKDIVLLDVTPLTLGIETLGGVMTPLIPANTTIPVKKSQVFTTAADMQTAVTIHVVQGERPLAKDDVSLGMFNLEGIPPAPRGVPQIEVTFDIDANGILNVSARDKGTGKEQRITISASNKLSKEEIERMKKEAEEFAEKDKQEKENIETLNNAESLAYTAEKTINDAGDKIDSATKDNIKAIVKDLRDAISQKDIPKVKEITEKLTKEIQEVGAKMYASASANNQNNTGNAGTSGENQSDSSNDKTSGENSDTVNADYKENK